MELASLVLTGLGLFASALIGSFMYSWRAGRALEAILRDIAELRTETKSRAEHAKELEIRIRALELGAVDRGRQLDYIVKRVDEVALDVKELKDR